MRRILVRKSLISHLLRCTTAALSASGTPFASITSAAGMPRQKGEKTMKRVTLALLALTLICMVSTAKADTINITPANAIEFIPGAGNPEIVPPLSLLEILYKANVGGAEEGAFAASYATSFVPSVDPTAAIITYVTAPAITGYTPLYLLVKDGAFGSYLFDLGPAGLNWNGTDTLNLSGFWADTEGAISHVSILGGTTTVPEPTTLLLLGAGLLGVGILGRKLR
jgi:hypothetical protein